MKQGLSQYQTQEQQQVLTQTLSPQQVLQVRMLELSTNELEERVRMEMDDNPALEASDDNAPDEDYGLENEPDEVDSEADFEQEERQDALQDVLNNLGSDDEMPSYRGGSQEESNLFYGETRSFYDELKEQISDYDLTETEEEVMEYLIGSLDDDGYLRRDTDLIADELALYHDIDVEKEDVDRVLKVLQSMDPAGIGAHDLQECMLLQISRLEDAQNPKPEKLLALMRTVVEDMFREFTLKHWDKIAKELGISNEQQEVLFHELCRLNPKPGSSYNEVMGKSMQQITPDFIVDTHDDGSISFYVNHANMPNLVISDVFEDVLNDTRTSKAVKEAQDYAKSKITAANDFIGAVKVRYQTMYATMKAIIERQRAFFDDGDESSMKPMILKDIAQRTGLDISTISRATKGKYVQTRWGTFPLRAFFNDAYVNADGEETSTIAIRQALKDIIDGENKKKPLSDQKLTQMLADKGFPIARRTVAKYREQLNIPVARLRK